MSEEKKYNRAKFSEEDAELLATTVKKHAKGSSVISKAVRNHEKVKLNFTKKCNPLSMMNGLIIFSPTSFKIQKMTVISNFLIKIYTKLNFNSF